MQNLLPNLVSQNLYFNKLPLGIYGHVKVCEALGWSRVLNLFLILQRLGKSD